MQDELDRDYPELDIELLGVNMAGYESGIPLMAEGRDLPLLQDTAEVDATGQWEAIWRDVFVLNADNEVTAIYNLTTHNLAEQANYEELRQLLLDAAAE